MATDESSLQKDLDTGLRNGDRVEMRPLNGALIMCVTVQATIEFQ